MWINPCHPDPPQPPTPPTDDAYRLATFPRGAEAELRVSLATYQGRPYINMRVWQRDGNDGQFWPVRAKGCSIRVHEIDDLVAGLRQVEDLIAAQAAGQVAPGQDETPVRPYDGRSGVQYERDDEARPRYTPRRGRPQPRSFEGEGIAVPRREFNEFD